MREIEHVIMLGEVALMSLRRNWRAYLMRRAYVGQRRALSLA